MKTKIIFERKSLFVLILVALLSGIIPEYSAARGEPVPGDKNIPPELVARKLKKRNPDYGITVRDVIKESKIKPAFIMIDTRNRQAFEKYRLPGSINIPSHAIKTKAFLKRKALVLLNEGYRYARLEKTCKELRSSGFENVRILEGGLYALRQAGVKLSGDFFSQREMNRMPPAAFFEEKNYEHYTIIDVSATRSDDSNTFIPFSTHAPFSPYPARMLDKMTELSSQNTSDGFRCFLLFNSNGQGHDAIEKIIAEAEIKNVYFLKGGLRGYSAFIEEQSLMWKQNEKRKLKKEKCPTCP
jgi:rhodanese-related sulfurtransferase